MIRSARARFLTAAVAVVAAGAIASVSAAAAPQQLRPEVQNLVGAGAPGALLLVRSGGTTTELVAGFANVERRTPLRVGATFRVGSLTKTFVATVVLQLVAERKLSLDDPVARYFPGVVPNARAITIRELLDHTSGIPEFDSDPRVLRPYLRGNLGYVWTPRALIRIATSHTPLFRPGARYSYSNTN